MKQLEFDFGIKNKPKENLPHFLTPQNDNEKMLELQYCYLKNNNKKALAELWIMAIQLAKKIIHNERKKRGCFLSREDIEDKASEAVIYVLRRYEKTNGKWFVKKNFISEIFLGVIHALDYDEQKRKQQEKSALIKNQTNQKKQILLFEEA